ncbi:MAG: gamma-glutamyl-gamma-aminobutyrate hydrolase family protein [Saprospiraceae bacterium]|nr:gamma-glutamyl-gamma-aminobutyrate hydrolase family protein [Saprospiraceae bacterium]
MKPRLGILLCDKVSRHYQSDGHPDYPVMFRSLLPAFEHVHYRLYADEFPTDLTACDAWLATGSRRSVYDPIPWISKALELIREVDQKKMPFCGVCFGHQLIGHALGGTVAKAPQGWNVGVHAFSVVEHDPWMNPPKGQLKVIMMCQDQIVKLPDRARILARTPLCPVAMLALDEHILGIQGHPEFSTSFERQLLEDRVELIGAKIVDTGLASLSLSPDKIVLGQWITNFLSQQC